MPPKRTGSRGDLRVDRAIAFAARAHARQLRKDGRTPYIAHPVGVMRFLSGDLGITDTAVLVAALLHDVVEDTPVGISVLRARFGDRVAQLVRELTVPAEYHGPAVPDAVKTGVLRSAVDRMSWTGVLIKLADRYDNLSDMANAAWSPRKRAAYRLQTRGILRTLQARASRDSPPLALKEPIEHAVRAIRRLLAGRRRVQR